MKTEIVIAARGELAKNLNRTVEQASESAGVCVVFDGNERGNECPDYVLEKARVLRIDGPCGCGAARHAGITSSEADLIVLCDGHMAFPRGWMDTIEGYHRKRHKHLACCRMQSLDQKGNPLSDKPQGGAFIAYRTTEVLQNHWGLSAKWNNPPAKAGPVAAVMGACYSFRRKWYDKIGQPLQILRAWGGDEEILSLSTHLMGGKVEMLPVTVGHIYMAAHNGRVKTADETEAIWANRYAIVDAMPMPEPEREGLRDWMSRSPKAWRRVRGECKKAVELRAFLESGPVAWSSLKDAGVVRGLNKEEQAACLHLQNLKDDAKRYTPPPAPEKDKSQVVVRHEPVCDRCGARNSFRQVAGRRNTGAFGTACSRCKNCGHKAQIRFL